MRVLFSRRRRMDAFPESTSHGTQQQGGEVTLSFIEEEKATGRPILFVEVITHEL